MKGPPSTGKGDAPAAMPAGGAVATGSAGPAAQSDFDFKVLRLLGSRYLRALPGMIFLYIAGHILIQTLVPQQTAVYLGKLTNHFSGGSAKGGTPSEPLLQNYFFWLGLTVVLVAGGYGFQYLVSRFDGSITRRIKADLFATLLRQSPAYYHQHDSDRLTLIVTQFANQVSSSLRRLLIEPVLQLIAVAIIGVTIYQALTGLTRGPAVWTIAGINGVWVMFGITLVFALTSPWIVSRMGKYLQRDASAVQEQNLSLATLVGGALKAPEEIQAMRAEPVFSRKLDALLARSLDLQLAQTRTMEKINAFSRLPGTVVLAAFLGLAIFLEMKGGSGEPGTIVQVALLTPLLMSAIQQLSSFGINSRMSWPSLEMVHSILATHPPEEKTTPAGNAEPADHSIEARDLVFSYQPGKRPKVLDGASFTIPTGKVTGFVARPGQGKTTFFRLALRFYDWQAGDILLGGIPIRDMPLDSLRRHIVLMSQFPAFFYDSVRENMRVAAPAATDEEILQAARLTGLDAVLERSMGPGALDLPFAAGAGLSGGQKKLFALTRCLLRQPSVLLLDEPTTGMGPLEKFPLIDAMRHALGGRTVIVVDHDIVWQTKFCDHIHVLDGGRIVQSGSPQDLVATPGLFRSLYDEASDRAPAAAASPSLSAKAPQGAMAAEKTTTTTTTPGHHV